MNNNFIVQLHFTEIFLGVEMSTSRNMALYM